MNLHAGEFYIGGQWVAPRSSIALDVLNPATEQSITKIAMGCPDDVDSAVSEAKAAFGEYSRTTKHQRLTLMDSIIEVFTANLDDLAELISLEMGAPIAMARRAQAPFGLEQFVLTRRLLENYVFERESGTTLVLREPIGVCALITPWNWPIYQISCKVAPALAAGCTMVLKPSEVAPLNALFLANILHQAGVPKGVFNLVNGDAENVGQKLASHPDVDLVSLTGSTRAGVDVSRTAASTVKRVVLELGGKSANILLDDVDFPSAIARDAASVWNNSGQSCNAPTRMLVPAARMDEAAEIAAATASAVVIGDPSHQQTTLGPLASAAQFERVQRYIEAALGDGARLVAGGSGKPPGFETGYYVAPTVLADVSNDMPIAREEVFGPVLVLIGYEDDEDAVNIANDTLYGLSGYVSGSSERARSVARRMRTGQVHLNGAPRDPSAPFGGYKQSGLGRERGDVGLEEFLEVKSILGYQQA